jgi:hypothetical protein
LTRLEARSAGILPALSHRYERRRQDAGATWSIRLLHHVKTWQAVGGYKGQLNRPDYGVAAGYEGVVVAALPALALSAVISGPMASSQGTTSAAAWGNWPGAGFDAQNLDTPFPASSTIKALSIAGTMDSQSVVGTGKIGPVMLDGLKISVIGDSRFLLG